MPSTAENIELVKIRATDQVAINIIEHVSCKFVKFVGKKSEIRGPKEIIRGHKKTTQSIQYHILCRKSQIVAWKCLNRLSEDFVPGYRRCAP